MPLLINANVLQAFRFIDHPSLKSVKKRIRQKSKHFREKVKKVLRHPFNRRVHCKDTHPPTPPKCTSIGVQTSFSSLIVQLSHEGDIDMSRHGYSHNTNSNNSQGPGSSLQYVTDHRQRVSGSSSSRTTKPSSPASKRKPMKAISVQTSGMIYTIYSTHHLSVPGLYSYCMHDIIVFFFISDYNKHPTMFVLFHYRDCNNSDWWYLVEFSTPQNRKHSPSKQSVHT